MEDCVDSDEQIATSFLRKRFLEVLAKITGK